MNIILIYKKYGIPENLQMHMLRVAGCANYIIDNWNGPKLNKEKIIKILLLHDMGNIVKIKEKITDKNYIKNKEKYLKIFGNDDHKISESIAKENGLDEESIKLMSKKVFVNNENIMNSNDFQLKIMAYCDQRVAPDGVYSLTDRLTEAKGRYKDKPGSSMNNDKTDYLIECALKIEEQISNHILVSLDSITDINISKYITKLKEFTI